MSEKSSSELDKAVAIRGLQRRGRAGSTAELREKTLDLVARTPDIYGYYYSQTVEGLGSRGTDWTAASHIDLIVNPDRIEGQQITVRGAMRNIFMVIDRQCRNVGFFQKKAIFAFLAMAFLFSFNLIAGETPNDKEFPHRIQPLMAKYCHACHGEQPKKNELNLMRFTSVQSARDDSHTWETIHEQLRVGEMPPEKAAQPTADERRLIMQWTKSMLDEEALSRAGDPGRVTLRRLTNAEYDNTIRDLTGVDLKPAKDFPTDGAAGEGFSNVGDVLAMSAGLASKYHAAAQAVAAHAVLLPDGFRFSKSDEPQAWVSQALQSVRDFYGRFRSGSGRLDVGPYLAALVKHKVRLSKDDREIDRVAIEEKINRRYLEQLWKGLNSTHPSPILETIREQWRKANAKNLKPFIENIKAWQDKLSWTYEKRVYISVGTGYTPYQMPGYRVVDKETIKTVVRIPGTESQTPAVTRVGEKSIVRKQPDLIWHLVTRSVGKCPPGTYVRWDRLRLERSGEVTVIANHPELKRLVETSTGLRFGVHPLGGSVPADALVVSAPSDLRIPLPADLTLYRYLMADVSLDSSASESVTIQAQMEYEPDPTDKNKNKFPAPGKNLVLDEGDHREALITRPAVREARAKAYDDVRELFPRWLFYAPVATKESTIILRIYHREDEQLKNLFLDQAQTAEIDRLWSELHFLSRDALEHKRMYPHFLDFMQQHARPFEYDFNGPIVEAEAAAFEKILAAAEPTHVESLLAFAAKAWRRPLDDSEIKSLREVYRQQRNKNIDHDAAFRTTLSQILASPWFIYRIERPAKGPRWQAINDHELASRMSYFLWSSLPDKALIDAAQAKELRNPEKMKAQIKRMLLDDRVRGLATEFGSQWLQVRNFSESARKSEKIFPEFTAELRSAMAEETVMWFKDFFQADRAAISLITGDATFVNQTLAEHYGLPPAKDDVKSDNKGERWRRIDGVARLGRGGLLGLSSALSHYAGAGRTSPVKRGVWIAENLLGEHLPQPPADVPVLPEAEEPDDLTVRQLSERHSSDHNCVGCHKRIDPYGATLEQFDAIGRLRTIDSKKRPIDARATLPDGTVVNGIAELKSYLAGPRRTDVLRIFSRKLLGYALGRAVTLSDRPLIDEMVRLLQDGDGKVSQAILALMQSEQFLCIRTDASTSK